jgi:hypothetical protein
VLVALLVVGLVGGGLYLLLGGGVSKEEFIEQADAVCRQTFEESLALAESGNFDPADLESNGRLIQDVTVLLEDQTQSIVALEPPEEDRDILDEWLNTQRALADVFRSASSAALEGDQKGFDAAYADANAIQARSSELAAAYGFEVCGLSTPA